MGIQYVLSNSSQSAKMAIFVGFQHICQTLDVLLAPTVKRIPILFSGQIVAENVLLLLRDRPCLASSCNFLLVPLLQDKSLEAV